MKPNHVDIADFLQEISTDEGAGYLKPGQEHLTTDEFVDAYMASDMYKDVIRILDEQEVNLLMRFKVNISLHVLKIGTE